MKSPNEVILTPHGVQELKDELEILIKVDRPRIIHELKEAREQQDLSENAGYEAARTAQALTENKINKIEGLLKVAVIVQVNGKAQNIVKLGDKIQFTNISSGEKTELQILGPIESNPFKNIISSASPLGQSLLNHKIGAVVTIKSPDGIYKVKINKITVA